MNDRFRATLGTEDQWRPGWSLGWECRPPQRGTIRWHGFEKRVAFIDRLDGRAPLIYIEPWSNTPATLFVNSARVKIRNKDVVLDNGSLVRSGLLMNPAGKRQAMERPQQILPGGTVSC